MIPMKNTADDERVKLLRSSSWRTRRYQPKVDHRNHLVRRTWPKRRIPASKYCVNHFGMWCRRRESNDTPLLITRNLLKKHERKNRTTRCMPCGPQKLSNAPIQAVPLNYGSPSGACRPCFASTEGCSCTVTSTNCRPIRPNVRLGTVAGVL